MFASIVIKTLSGCLSEEFEHGSSRIKTSSQELKIEKNLVNTLEATVPVQISLKLVREVVLMIFRSCLNMGHLSSKTRPHSPNMEKTLVNTLGGYWFGPNVLEIGQKRIFDDF